MNMMLNDVDNLAADVFNHSVDPFKDHKEEEVKQEKEQEQDEKPSAKVKQWRDFIGSIWYIWLFRALVWNRSCTFIRPIRVGAGGKRYDRIPSEWHDSRLPVHII